MRVTNYVQNPRGLGAVQSFTGLAATISAPGSPVTATLTSASEGGLRLRAVEEAPAEPGQPWFALGALQIGAQTVGSRRVRVRLRFLSGTGSELGVTSLSVLFEAPEGIFESPSGSGRYRIGTQPLVSGTRVSTVGLVPVEGSSTRFVPPSTNDSWLSGYYQVSAVAPTGTAKVSFDVVREQTGEASAGDTITLVTPTLTTTTSKRPLEPFDGSSTSSYWSGAVNGSPSYRVYTEPELSPIPSMTPVPRVEFKFTDLAPGTETATVFRVTAERTQRVRGAIGVYAAGGFSGIDTEPPFGWPVGPEVTYRAQMFDAAGADLGFSDAAATTVDFRGTVIQQPVAPSRSVQVLAEVGMAESIERPFEGDLVRPIGRSVPVYIGNGRTGIQGVNLTVVTFTRDDQARLASVFGGYGDEQLPVICLRSSHELGLPQPFFALVKSPVRVPADVRNGGETVVWKMTGDEAAPPIEAIVVALLTYEDLETAYATYADLEAAYLTYFDAESDFDLAGSSE